MGGAAHATQLHHGSGAGQVIEDAAILIAILTDSAIRTAADIPKAFPGLRCHTAPAQPAGCVYLARFWHDVEA